MKKSKLNLAAGVSIILLFVITFYPFFLLIFGSLKNKMQLVNNPWFLTFPLHFENYSIAFGQIVRPIFNSFVVTFIGIGITLVASALAAFVIAQLELPGKKIVYYYIISLLMVPGFVILIPQFLVVRDMHLYDTYLGQVFPPAANNIAMGVLLMTTFFKGLSKSIMESAKVEGCSNMQMFARIVLPLSKPIIATVSITTGLNFWNNYMWPLIITTSKNVSPVIVAVTRLKANIKLGEGPLFAAYVIASIPILLLFAVASEQFVEGITAGAVKG
ncbi:MAG TPA: carbohydrate ABC transporter permease [Clostridiales bacterium]|nr:carbohydrate ABC transporter permease [Clostridiales bacterium]